MKYIACASQSHNYSQIGFISDIIKNTSKLTGKCIEVLNVT